MSTVVPTSFAAAARLEVAPNKIAAANSDADATQRYMKLPPGDQK
jgi:hypothetical protein